MLNNGDVARVSLNVSDHGGLSKVDERLRFQVTDAIKTTFDEEYPAVVAELRHRAPVSHGPGGGRFKDSIKYGHRYSIPGRVEMRFVSSVPYAPFVIEPTQAHVIRPTAARALHWKTTSGSSVFASVVQHPGTHGNDFATQAARVMSEILQLKIAEKIRRLM